MNTQKRAKDLYALIDAINGLKSEQGVDALMYYNEKAGDGYLALLEQLGTLDKDLHKKAHWENYRVNQVFFLDKNKPLN